jgi:hypothetical protein
VLLLAISIFFTVVCYCGCNANEIRPSHTRLLRARANASKKQGGGGEVRFVTLVSSGARRTVASHPTPSAAPRGSKIWSLAKDGGRGGRWCGPRHQPLRARLSLWTDGRVESRRASSQYRNRMRQAAACVFFGAVKGGREGAQCGRVKCIDKKKSGLAKKKWWYKPNKKTKKPPPPSPAARPWGGGGADVGRKV